MSIEQTEAESQAVSKGAPRVTLAEMESKIVHVLYVDGLQAASASPGFIHQVFQDSELRQLEILTICIVMIDNGFMVVGKSAPASPDNFDASYGRKLAYDDAIRQLWRLEGYALRAKLADRG